MNTRRVRKEYRPAIVKFFSTNQGILTDREIILKELSVGGEFLFILTNMPTNYGIKNPS